MSDAQARFQQILKIVSANYGKPLTAEQVELFKIMAKQHGVFVFSDAMMAHLQDPDSGMFFPTMAHISAKITGTKKENEASLTAKAETEWLGVMNKIRRVGAYDSPQFDDPLTVAAVAALGGWISVCRKTEDELKWLGKNFVGEYRSASERNPEFLPNRLGGIIEAQNKRIESTKAALSGKSSVTPRGDRPESLKIGLKAELEKRGLADKFKDIFGGEE